LPEASQKNAQDTKAWVDKGCFFVSGAELTINASLLQSKADVKNA